MLKGGYQILDFSGVIAHSEQTVNVPGIYEKIEGTRKAILISGLTFNGIEMHDMFVIPVKYAGKYQFRFEGYDEQVDAPRTMSIIIGADDNVQFGY